MSESTKKIRCAAVITNNLGQLLVLQQGDIYRLPSREIEYTQNTNECIEAALREVQESCQIRGVQVDVATGLLELDPETPELPPSSTPDSEPCPVWLAKKKEQQLAANLWNVYSHPTDLALSIALMQRSQLDMTNAQ